MWGNPEHSAPGPLFFCHSFSLCLARSRFLSFSITLSLSRSLSCTFSLSLSHFLSLFLALSLLLSLVVSITSPLSLLYLSLSPSHTLKRGPVIDQFQLCLEQTNPFIHVSGPIPAQWDCPLHTEMSGKTPPWWGAMNAHEPWGGRDREHSPLTHYKLLYAVCRGGLGQKWIQPWHFSHTSPHHHYLHTQAVMLLTHNVGNYSTTFTVPVTGGT